jgi:dTDP-4-dehydrorhamnose reductase
MQTYEDKIDAAVHAAMYALGLSAERLPQLAETINDFLTEVCARYVTDDEEV